MKKTDKKAVTKAVKKTTKKSPAKKTAEKKPMKTAVVKKSTGSKALMDLVGKKTAPKSSQKNELYEFIIKALDQEKGENITTIDMKGKSSIADYMIVVSGSSSRQIVMMAKKVRDKIVEKGFKARVEGADSGDWVIVDAVDVIIHLFRPEVRAFYNLEKLWATDFSTVDYTLYKNQE